MDLGFHDLMSDIVKVFELVGVAIFVVGSAMSFFAYPVQLVRGAPRLRAPFASDDRDRSDRAEFRDRRGDGVAPWRKRSAEG